MSPSAKAVTMSKDESMLLVHLVEKNAVINNKANATNVTNNKLKEQAWLALTKDHNAIMSSTPRTPAMLRLKWENLKKEARKRSADIRSSQQTGNGKHFYAADEVLDKVASLLGIPCRLPAEFGGDDDTSNEQDDEILPFKPKNRRLSRASGSRAPAKRKLNTEEEESIDCESKGDVQAEYWMAKKKKIDLENTEKEILIAKLKLELENARLENLKLKNELKIANFKTF